MSDDGRLVSMTGWWVTYPPESWARRVVALAADGEHKRLLLDDLTWWDYDSDKPTDEFGSRMVYDLESYSNPHYTGPRPEWT